MCERLGQIMDFQILLMFGRKEVCVIIDWASQWKFGRRLDSRIQVSVKTEHS